MVEKTVDSPWHEETESDKLDVSKGTSSNSVAYKLSL